LNVRRVGSVGSDVYAFYTGDLQAVVDDGFEGALHRWGPEEGDQYAAEAAGGDDGYGVLGCDGSAFCVGSEMADGVAAEASDRLGGDSADLIARGAFAAGVAAGVIADADGGALRRIELELRISS